MQSTHTDIFVIGGGINGVGIAADAAGRGLTVTLCEKNDLASATSSASSKLIHGGLRYLENYEFKLVREALKEREILMNLAPFIIHPLEFIMPYESHLRPAWMIRLGLFIYDHLAAHPSMPNSKSITFNNNEKGKFLQESFKKGFSYFDCATDDARLVVLNAMAAKKNGASILTKHEFISAEYLNDTWKITVKNKLNDTLKIFESKVLVNASGPWISESQKNILSTKNLVDVDLVKGSHIVVPKIFDGDFAYILQNSDTRIVFAIPYQKDFTLVGTTDVKPDGNLSSLTASDAEKIYLCNTINNYFNKKINVKDIIWSYAGVRTLQAEHTKKLSKISRDFKIELNSDKPLLTVISGKLTTYRCLAEKAVDSLKKFFPTLKSSTTISTLLPGGDIPNKNFKLYLETIFKKYFFLPKDLVERYAKNYGTRIENILEGVTSLKDLGTDFSNSLYETEVKYLIHHEWALEVEDILWRRTKLGLAFSTEQTDNLDKWLKNYFSK